MQRQAAVPRARAAATQPRQAKLALALRQPQLAVARQQLEPALALRLAAAVTTVRPCRSAVLELSLVRGFIPAHKVARARSWRFVEAAVVVRWSAVPRSVPSRPLRARRTMLTRQESTTPSVLKAGMLLKEGTSPPWTWHYRHFVLEDSCLKCGPLHADLGLLPRAK